MQLLNVRTGDGNRGIIRSPLRGIVLPDPRARAQTLSPSYRPRATDRLNCAILAARLLCADIQPPTAQSGAAQSAAAKTGSSDA